MSVGKDQPKAPVAPKPPELPEPVDSAVLLAGRTSLRIVHRGQEYRLQVTRLGKLILTK